MFLFFKDIVKGVRRRRNEIMLLTIVQFVVMTFITVSLLFQHNSENYNFEKNKENYGDWVVAEVITDEATGYKLSEHPYFSNLGKAVSGINIVDVKEKEYKYYLGSMDKGLIELGHIELREGSFPESDNEIAMEVSLLIEMGYSLELGQDVKLRFKDDEGNIEDKSFKLVGIIKKSASLWCIGDYMPSALVTDNVINRLDGKLTTTYCYQLSEQYKDVDTKELYNNLNEKYNEGKNNIWRLEYNEYLYSGSFWGTAEMYNFIEKAVIVLGMAAMSFLLAVYIQKRKKYYYNLRILGMSKLKVKIVIIFESLCFSFISGISAVLITMLIGGIISYVLSVSQNLVYFYEIPISLAGKILLAWFIIFAGADLVAIVVTGRKRLYDNTHEISTRFLFRCQLNKLKHKHIYSSIFVREHRVFKLRNIFGNLVTVGFAAILMLCGARLWEEYINFEYVYGSFSDFVALKSAEAPVEEREYKWIQNEEYGSWREEAYGYKQISEGYLESFYQKIENISGIASYSLSAYDNSHLFEWDNMENDPYIRALLTQKQGGGSYRDENGNMVNYVNTMEQVLNENSLYFGYAGWYISDRKIYDRYAKDYGTTLMDYEEFQKGNQVIVIMPEIGSYITEGSSLRIITGDEKIEVMVACVASTDGIGVKYAHYITGGINSDTVFPGLYILGSENLGRKIAKAEEKEYRYNRIEINMNSLADYDITVKQCAKLLDIDNVSVETNYEIKQMKFREWITTVIMYCTFITLLLAFFIIIRNNIIQAGFTFKENQIRQLRMLGMDKTQIKKMYLLQGLYESKWVWIAVIITYVLCGYNMYEKYNNSGYFVFIDELGIYTEEIKDIILYTIDKRVNIWICLIVIIMIMLVNIVTRYFVVKNYLKEIEAE